MGASPNTTPSEAPYDPTERIIKQDPLIVTGLRFSNYLNGLDCWTNYVLLRIVDQVVRIITQTPNSVHR